MSARRRGRSACESGGGRIGRGDDTVGNPHRAQISQFELFELILSLKLDKQLAVEQFEATASQSAVITPPPRAGGGLMVSGVGPRCRRHGVHAGRAPVVMLVELRGWRNAVEVVLFEIANSMKPPPSVFHA